MDYRTIRSSGKTDWLIYITIAVAVAFHVFTIRPGHSWNGDFALYISHAKNIADGLPYADVGYVYSTRTSLMSPGTYPPVYPAFLAPLYRVFGLDLHVFKVAGLLAFALFLVALDRYARTFRLSTFSRLVIVIAVGFSHWVWRFKDQVLPDFLFMLICILAILLIDGRRDERAAMAVHIGQGVLIGLLVYLAYGTRTLGMMLLPALFAYDLARFRKLTLAALVATPVFAAAYLVQNIYLQTDLSYFNSYIDFFRTGQEDVPASVARVDDAVAGGADIGFATVMQDMLSRVANNLNYYHNNMLFYWSNNISVGIEIIAYVLAGLFALAGFLWSVIARASSGHFFLVFYMLVLLVVPFRQDRYLLPLLPLYFIYIMLGVEWFSAWLRQRQAATVLRSALQVTVLAALLFLYYGNYRLYDFEDLGPGIARPETIEMFDYIRQELPDDSLLMFREPRILALYTDRRAVSYYWPKDRQELWQFILDTGVTHIVSHRRDAGLYQDDWYLEEFVKAYSERLEPLFFGSAFEIYRVRHG